LVNTENVFNHEPKIYSKYLFYPDEGEKKQSGKPLSKKESASRGQGVSKKGALTNPVRNKLLTGNKRGRGRELEIEYEEEREDARQRH
jgi:hypothetical protein